MLIPPQVFHVANLADPHPRFATTAGVRVERDADGKPWIVAVCGGAAMIRVTWPEDDPTDWPGAVKSGAVPGFSATVPVRPWKEVAVALKAVCRETRKPLLKHALLEESAPLRFVTNDMQTERIITVPPLEGRFPEWRTISDAPDAPGPSVRVHAELLIDLLRTVLAVADADKPYVTLTLSREPGGVMAVTAEHMGRDVLGLLQPLAEPKS